jgi:hypothetical protein
MTLFTTVSMLILVALAIHWVFDFVLQSNWMATNKSKSNVALGAHVGIYTCGMALLAVTILGPTAAAIWFTLINGGLHFITDYCTSRVTSHLWQKTDVHNFFVVVGFDQLIHATTLIVTINAFTSL